MTLDSDSGEHQTRPQDVSHNYVVLAIALLTGLLLEGHLPIIASTFTYVSLCRATLNIFKLGNLAGTCPSAVNFLPQMIALWSFRDGGVR